MCDSKSRNSRLPRVEREDGPFLYLIAGNVKRVVMHFETAPKTVAENAERASGDVALSLALLILFFNTLCFGLSNFSFHNTKGD